MQQPEVTHLPDRKHFYYQTDRQTDRSQCCCQLDQATPVYCRVHVASVVCSIRIVFTTCCGFSMLYSTADAVDAVSIVPTVVLAAPSVPLWGGMTSSRSFGFILFQIFLMIALSSSFSCSGIPNEGPQWAERYHLHSQQIHLQHQHRLLYVSHTVGFNLEGGANQRKESSVEGDHSITVQRHVHGHQTLEETKTTL